MSEPETLVLLRARTAIEAQVVLALLRGEGLTAFVNGSALMDEFAVSQRLMGLQGVEISVRREDLPRAQQLLDEARQVGQRLGDATEPVPAAEPEPPLELPRRRLAPKLAMLGWAAAVAFLFLWLDAKRQADAVSAAHGTKFLKTEPTPNGWRSIWKDTGRTAVEDRDANHNGIAETITTYTRAGWPSSIGYDANEDGHIERVERYARDGQRVAEMRDDDEDGVFETQTSFHADGSRSGWQDDDQDGELNGYDSHAPDGRLVTKGTYEGGGLQRTATAHYPDGHWCLEKDLDGDGLFDELEFYDETGLLVRRQVDRGLDGFVDVK